MGAGGGYTKLTGSESTSWHFDGFDSQEFAVNHLLICVLGLTERATGGSGDLHLLFEALVLVEIETEKLSGFEAGGCIPRFYAVNVDSTLGPQAQYAFLAFLHNEIGVQLTHHG